MRSLRYLNSVLTVIAVLLSANVYALWTSTPGGEAFWPAQRANAAERPEPGVPNASQQRKEMVDLLKNVNAQLGDLKSSLKDGTVRVRIEAAPSGQ
jgi:hypothetical protein